MPRREGSLMAMPLCLRRVERMRGERGRQEAAHLPRPHTIPPLRIGFPPLHHRDGGRRRRKTEGASEGALKGLAWGRGEGLEREIGGTRKL